MEMSLSQMMLTFVKGDDTSIELANAIELEIEDEFPDDDYMQQTLEMLAMYRPKGGDFLFDTAAIKQRLSETLRYMEGIGDN
jgi:hypothetical protein